MNDAYMNNIVIFQKEDYSYQMLKRADRREKKHNCYVSYHQVLLNGTRLHTSFMQYDHPITKQFGLVAYVQLKQADYGKNTLTIRKKFVDADPIKQ